MLYFTLCRFSDEHFINKFNKPLLFLFSVLLLLFASIANAQDSNLALGKPTTQSSIQSGGVSSRAVDGNTSGNYSHNSTTHTQSQQGAWWRVDLQSDQTINQIIIYNRTNCCKGRLTNYRVSVATDADFNTITYQQDFHVYPNPSTTIDLGDEGIQGRYVKVQLLNKNSLSLAEVQVIGNIDNKGEKGDKGDKGDTGSKGDKGDIGISIRGEKGDKGDTGVQGIQGVAGANGQDGTDGDTFFAQVGTAVSLQGQNDLTVIGGKFSTTGDIKVGNSYSVCDSFNAGAIRYNNITNLLEFCNATAWQEIGGDAPNLDDDCDWACQLGSASSLGGAFHMCALKTDNTVACWGQNDKGQTDVPTGLIAKQVASGNLHSCALKTDNTVACWGQNDKGQTDVPTGLIAKQVASGNSYSCALKADNTIECWGSNEYGIIIAVPSNIAAKQIALGVRHSCALQLDGDVVCWGNDSAGQTTAPNNLVAKQITSGNLHSCALKMDNTVVCWGHNYFGQTTVPSELTAKQIVSEGNRSCALKMDNTVACWGKYLYEEESILPNLIAKRL